jgi:hypothetical protein
LALPPGAQLPEGIQRALEAAPRHSIGNRESLQRKRFWWLPYVVLEFDKNEILIDALGGDLSNPVWNYRAQLSVFTLYYSLALDDLTLFLVMFPVPLIFLSRRICVLLRFKDKMTWGMIYLWHA